jgi:ferredoxin
MTVVPPLIDDTHHILCLHGAGQPISKWLVGTPQSRAPDAHETRGVFVVSAASLCCVHCQLSYWLTAWLQIMAGAECRPSAVQDEVACIGCKQCVWIAPGTFRIEADHGRSRVFAQWADNEDDTQAHMQQMPYHSAVFGSNVSGA